MVFRSSLAAACVGLLIPCTVLRADNWPEFRGPTGQGHAISIGLPVQWSPSENVRWKTSIPGKGWSSPVYYEGRIYLSTSVAGDASDQDDQSLRALCADALTGDMLWNVELFDRNSVSTGGLLHKKNSHASSTPIIDGKNLFVHFGTQGTACLDLDGNLLWRSQELPYIPRHGNGGSPALVGDLVVVTCDGQDVSYVAALDRNTGKVRWKTDRTIEELRQKFSFSTPLAIEVNGRTQIVCPGTGLVGAYEPQTGTEIWRVDYGTGYSVIPRPVYGRGLVYVCTGWGTPSLLAIDPTGAGNVTETHVVWQKKSKSQVPHTPSLLLVDEDLYLLSDTGIVSCLNAQTGEQHWRQRIGGNYSASPVWADGKIYCQSEDGDTVIFRPGRTYKEVARNQLNARTLASYAIADSALFIRTTKLLSARGLST